MSTTQVLRQIHNTGSNTRIQSQKHKYKVNYTNTESNTQLQCQIHKYRIKCTNTKSIIHIQNVTHKYKVEHTNIMSNTQTQNKTHEYEVKNTNTKSNTQSYRDYTRTDNWWEMEYTNETIVDKEIELKMGTIYCTVQVPQILHSSSK